MRGEYSRSGRPSSLSHMSTNILGRSDSHRYPSALRNSSPSMLTVSRALPDPQILPSIRARNCASYTVSSITTLLSVTAGTAITSGTRVVTTNFPFAIFLLLCFDLSHYRRYAVAHAQTCLDANLPAGRYVCQDRIH